MNISGNIILNDSSRHSSNTGQAGFMFDVAPMDLIDGTAVTIYGYDRLSGDATFLQGQIIGTGDLDIELKNWIYYGGHQQPDTTWVDGTWMFRWFSPTFLNYSIWHKPYDTTVFSQIGCPLREPVMANTGSYYASMVVPQTPGHYEIHWSYLKDQSSLARGIVESFTSVSRGIDAMPDYPYPAGYVYSSIPPTDAPLVNTLPTYEFKNLGETAAFTLQLIGPIPAPITYQWRMNGNNVYDGSKFAGATTDTLIISNLTMAEAGSFTCVVSSTITSSKSWLVLDPP